MAGSDEDDDTLGGACDLCFNPDILADKMVCVEVDPDTEVVLSVCMAHYHLIKDEEDD